MNQDIILYRHNDQFSIDDPFWQKLLKGCALQPFDQLILVPSLQLKEGIMQLLFRELPDATCFPPILTLDAYVKGISFQKTPLHSGFESVLFRNLYLRELEGNGKTPFFESQGVIRSIYRFLSLLPYYFTENINESNLGGLTVGSISIYRLYEQFQAIKAQLGIMNQSDYYQDAILVDRPFLPHHQILYVIGFFESIPLKNQAIQALIQQTETVYWLLTEDIHVPKATAVFMNWLQTSVHAMAVGTGLMELPMNRPQARLKKCLSPDMEINWIAQKIAALRAENPALHLADIGVVCPNMDAYGALIFSVFAQYDLPLDCAVQVPLLNSPVGILLDNLFEAFLSLGKRADIIRFLKSPFVKGIYCTDDEKFIEWDADFIRQMMEKLHITAIWPELNPSVVKDWRVVWQKYGEEHASYIAVLETQENTDLVKLAAYHRTQAQLTVQFHALIQWVQLIEVILRSQSAAEWIQGILSLLEHLGIFSEVGQPELDSILLLLRQFSDFYNLSGNVDWRSNEHGTLAIESLRVVLSEVTYTASPAIVGGVHVYEKMESFGIPLSVVFICGCIEGYWPTGPQFNFFSSEIYEQFHLPNHSTYVEQDRFIFYRLFANAKHAVYLTYPAEKDGQSCLLSHFIDRIQLDKNVRIDIETDDFLPFFSDQERLCQLGTFVSGSQDSLSLLEKFDFPELTVRYQAFVSSQENGGQTVYSGCFEHTPLESYFYTYFQDYAFSATRLEAYQSCPYAFFVRYILKEEAPAIESDEVRHDVWGNIIHEIMCQFYKSSIPFGWPHQLESRVKAQSKLMQIAKQILSRVGVDSIYWSAKKTALIGTEHKPGILSAFIEEETKRYFSLQPSACELPFLETFCDPDTHFAITLTGKIDAVLTSPTSSFLAVLDYKTGKTIPGASDILNFTHLQIPIYMMAAKRLNPLSEVAGGIVYQIRTSSALQKKAVCITSAAKAADLFNLKFTRPALIEDGYFSDLTAHLFQLKAALQSGFFGVFKSEKFAVSKRKCEYCQGRYVCRHAGDVGVAGWGAGA